MLQKPWTAPGSSSLWQCCLGCHVCEGRAASCQSTRTLAPAAVWPLHQRLGPARKHAVHGFCRLEQNAVTDYLRAILCSQNFESHKRSGCSRVHLEGETACTHWHAESPWHVDMTHQQHRSHTHGCIELQVIVSLQQVRLHCAC